MTKPAPKFKVGQIVVMKSIKKQLPFRIISAVWNEGWFYAWNSRNLASESMIRALTPEEYGLPEAVQVPEKRLEDALAAPAIPERCRQCGQNYVCWFTDSDIWNKSIPDSGMLCPNCFLLEAAIVIPTTGWKIVPEERTIALNVVKANAALARAKEASRG